MQIFYSKNDSAEENAVIAETGNRKVRLPGGDTLDTFFRRTIAAKYGKGSTPDRSGMLFLLLVGWVGLFGGSLRSSAKKGFTT